MEPGAPLGDRAGKLQPRRPFIDVEAAIAGHARNEVGAPESPAVVAHLGLQIQHARRAPAVIRRVTAVLQVHRLNRLDVDPRLQPSRHRVRDVEPVQRIVRLVGIAAVEVDPPRVVLHHAIEQRQRVAIVLRRRVRHTLDFRIRQFLAFRGLLRIDGRRGVRHIDSVRELLQVIQPDGELMAPRLKLLPAPCVQKEAQPFRANIVLARRRQAGPEVTRRVGRHGRGKCARRRAQFHARPAHRRAVLVHHTPGNRHLRSQRGAREACRNQNSRSVTPWQHVGKHSSPSPGYTPRPSRAAVYPGTKKGSPKAPPYFKAFPVDLRRRSSPRA